VPNLTSAQQKFILHWGEMGTRWGINRTVAQVHALLYLSPHPLHAEEIAGTLDVARSNVSNSLRELQGWGIVHVTHQLGDRRDHFESLTDVWEMFRIILEERKRREIDPTLKLLNECLADLKKDNAADTYARERVANMVEFMSSMAGLYDEAKAISPGALKGLLRLRGKLRGVLGEKKKTAEAGSEGSGDDSEMKMRRGPG
jgi:DNA-binding transcriptional regulator GbsR (MarR family)